MDSPEHTILCVDDEVNILNALKRLLRKEPYRLITCTSGAEALEHLANNAVHIVISDQRMPKMSGTEFLKQVKEQYPDIIRIILTGYTDVDTITQSINEGHIYKFFLKPWNDQHLMLEIRQAIEQYELIEANKRLHEMAVQQNAELKKINENLEHLVTERTRSLEQQNDALQLSHAILEDLPVPIVGISSELIVVLANKAAQEQFGKQTPIPLGEPICTVFDQLDEASLTEMIASSRRQLLCANQMAEKPKAVIELHPLTGRYAGSGAILTAVPVEWNAPEQVRHA